MNLPPSIQIKKQIPWQTERANKLNRACQCVKAAILRGENISKAIRCVARSYDGRMFKSDPARRLALSAATLRRLWDMWKRGGEVPAAFKLHYRARRPFIPAPLLVRFVEFCASNHLASMKTAWDKFSARGGSFGRGQHASKPLTISYGQVCYHFRAADFYLMQGEQKTIQSAQTRLAQLRLKVIADVRHRLPDRPPRRRVKPETDFQI